MVRAFVAIEMRPDERMLAVIKEMKAQTVKIKAVEKENMHLTIKFLGEISEEQVEKFSEGLKRLEKYGSFLLSLRGLGAFPSSKRPKVIWIGIDDNETLRKVWEVIESISEEIGIERDKRDFSPHLTLGRVKDPKNSWKLRDFIERHRNDEFGVFKIGKIKLKKSVLTPDGPIYSDLFSVKFEK